MIQQAKADELVIRDVFGGLAWLRPAGALLHQGHADGRSLRDPTEALREMGSDRRPR
jgi:hypothetical protein